MEIQVTNKAVIKEVSTEAFNVAEINKIKKLKGGAIRQDSKAPTFCSYLPGHMAHFGQ